jgi:GT2 family glycosyltransferase
MPPTANLGARPRVSLLMPNRDNEPTLDLVLGRLALHTTYSDVELVVVDDGSTDRSREILRAWRDSGRFPGDFQLIEQEPSGVVVALNKGLHAATGDIVVQLDADATIETPDWIQKLLAFFLSDPRIGVVTPKVIMDWGMVADRGGQVHAYGVSAISREGLHDRGTMIAEPAGRRKLHQRVRRFQEHGGDIGDAPAEVDCGIGCCMMYRRDVALEVGGYDMGYQPVWFDDLDLCLMIRRAGYKAFFVPDVRVIHRLSMRERDKPAPAKQGPAKRALETLRRAGAFVPPWVRERIVFAANLDKPPPAQLERLRHHYAYWRDKWGWDPLNPDMEEIRRRYGDTELYWAHDPERRAAGEDIIRAYRAGREHRAAALDVEADLGYQRRFGFLPPPQWATLTTYDHILGAIAERRLGELGGDAVEIGVFVGGGIAQLAQLWERVAPGRRVIAMDIFEPDVDETEATTGLVMSGIYHAVLGDRDQREVYDAVTAGLGNVETVVGDSRTVEIPTDKIAFAHIDGNHEAAYVRSDFERLWPLVVPGGVIAFDDYGHDLPEVTDTVDALRGEHAADIGDFWTAGAKTAFVSKRA